MQALLCFLLFFQAALPAAHFNGKVHTVSRKAITVDTDEGNEVEFAITRKSKAERAGKSVDLQSLQPGEKVSIDAELERLGYMVALKVIAADSQ
jgi:hypothetical protein